MRQAVTRRTRRWGIGIALLLVLAALRLPWRNADGGNLGLWSYGFFSTDEGYYTSGGKLAFLTGHYLDLEVGEPPTFRASWGMHWLSYLGYRFAGLSIAATRWPTMLAAIAGWLAAYIIASRVTSASVAGVLVLILSCNPVSLTYERVASTDIVMGAFIVIAFTLSTARRGRWAWLAGATAAAALSVKATAALLLPIIFLTLIARRRWRRVAAFAIALIVAFAISVALRNACIRAATVGWSAADVHRELTRAAFSPSWIQLNPGEWLTALSVFPRWPLSMQIGPMLYWLTVLAVWCALLSWQRGGRWLTKRNAIAWGTALYVGAMSTQVNVPLRYYLPLVYFVPALMIYARPLAFHDGRRNTAFCLLSVAVAILLYWLPIRASAEQFREQALNEYSLPAMAALKFTAWRMAISTLIVLAAIRFGIPGRRGSSGWLVTCGLAMSLVPVLFANFTLVHAAHDPALVRNQLLLQAGLVATCGVLLVKRRWRVWYLVQAVVFGAFIGCHSYWHQAYRELWTRSFLTRDVSRALADKLPANSIVIGRRAATLLRATPLRTGLGTPNYQPDEFVTEVTNLLERYPQRPLYWLVDSDGSFQWDFYREHGRDMWNVAPVATIVIPSGDQLQLRETNESALPLARVYVMHITQR